MKLTQHFRLSEFNSKDGAEMPADVLKNVLELACDLQTIRNEAGCPLHINSAYRSPNHNRAIGGVKNSQHILGKAADLSSRNHTPKELYDIIEGLIECEKIDVMGMGLYKSFVHVDIRDTYARWDNS